MLLKIKTTTQKLIKQIYKKKVYRKDRYLNKMEL